jgi:3-hydroxyisobutyrate dehydrogenase-like beta-hydroxyacid dehydrogenase
VRVGFVGLGTMGLPMVRHLLAAGHDLYVYARRAEIFADQAADVVARGAVVCESPAMLVKHCDVLMINVITTSDVESLCLGPKGVLGNARPGTIIVDHSTIDPDATKELATKAADAGLHWVDAPVSGGVWAAESGTLVTMMGGSDEAIAAVMPIVTHYTKIRHHVGPAGHGQIAKLCNQIAQVVTIQGVAESVHFARLMGGDPSRILDSMIDGMGGSPMMRLLGPKMVSGDFQAGIQLRLHAKDAQLAVEAAARLGSPLPATSLVASHYQQLVTQHLGDQDTASLIRLLEDLRP